MNEKKKQAILLLAMGKTGVQVAEQLQVTPKTVSTWRSDPEFRAELNKHLLDIKSAHSEHLRSLCTTALQTIENCLNDDKVPVKEKLAASFKVLQLGQMSPSRIGSSDPVRLALDEKLRL
tara:strand:- start:96 stop:455 length:360 start_codon:yes stop_codon:yes gene_type:complete